MGVLSPIAAIAPSMVSKVAGSPLTKDIMRRRVAPTTPSQEA
jgi:hypothetical protein